MSSVGVVVAVATSTPTVITSAPASAPASSSSSLDEELAFLASFITAHQDFPSPGIVFRDIFPLMRNPKASQLLNSRLTQLARAIAVQEPKKENPIAAAVATTSAPPTTVAASSAANTDNPSAIDCIIGLDSRGFLFGPTMAIQLDCSFAPIRKVGKLPGKCVKMSYQTEYSKAECEMQCDAITAGQRVVLVDDLLATGGTLASAISLVRSLGGAVVGCIVVIELLECNGRKRLIEECGMKEHEIRTLLTY